MDFSPFIDITPENAPQFFAVNAMAHETVFTALLSQGVVVPHYPLWVDALDRTWLDVHYEEHLSWSRQLAIPLPPDLSEVDFDDASATRQWAIEHLLHHQLVALEMDLP